jgi:hypothetical protein
MRTRNSALAKQSAGTQLALYHAASAISVQGRQQQHREKMQYT